jgi:hypothetical protein
MRDKTKVINKFIGEKKLDKKGVIQKMDKNKVVNELANNEFIYDFLNFLNNREWRCLLSGSKGLLWFFIFLITENNNSMHG